MAVGNPDAPIVPGLDRTVLRETARALNSGAVHLLRGMRSVDRLAGLTPARLSALSVLVFGGPCTLGRLAESEDVAGPTMTRIVDGLVELGLAERRPHPDSARSVQIRATRSGRALMRRAADRRMVTIVEAVQTLSPAEQACLVEAAPLLDAVAEAVRRPAGTALEQGGGGANSGIRRQRPAPQGGPRT
jgi:DNA-binding MarR family transcriptional regulator